MDGRVTRERLHRCVLSRTTDANVPRAQEYQARRVAPEMTPGDPGVVEAHPEQGREPGRGCWCCWRPCKAPAERPLRPCPSAPAGWRTDADIDNATDAVSALLARIGSDPNAFDLEMIAADGLDTMQLGASAGKVAVKGSSGVALASAVNW